MNIEEKAFIYVSYRMETGVFRKYEKFIISKISLSGYDNMVKIHILIDNGFQKTYIISKPTLENDDNIMKMKRKLILNKILKKWCSIYLDVQWQWTVLISEHFYNKKMYNISLKEKFVNWMIPQTFVNSNGIIVFPYSDVFHDPELNYISSDPGYRILKKKMKNLLKLINKNHKYGYMDIETELWDII